MLTKISVKQLFNVYDYDIDLNNADGSSVKFITGPNGYGKTTILEFIYALMMQSYEIMFEVPFALFSMFYEESDADVAYLYSVTRTDEKSKAADTDLAQILAKNLTVRLSRIVEHKETLIEEFIVTQTAEGKMVTIGNTQNTKLFFESRTCFYLNDHRLLSIKLTTNDESLMLDSGSVKQALRGWIPTFDEVFAKCIPICRHFGYLRIYNDVADLSVLFHKNLYPNKYWDYQQQMMRATWEEDSTTKFVQLSEGKCSTTDVNAFIKVHKLQEENLYDVCRGHDLLNLLSLILVDVQTYSVKAIMKKISDAYSLNNFKTTRLYAGILTWQTLEDLNVLVA